MMYLTLQAQLLSILFECSFHSCSCAAFDLVRVQLSNVVDFSIRLCLIAGLTSLSEKLASARTYLQAQIRTLTTKQDQAMTVQSAMQDHLNVVGRDVEEARCDIAEVRKAQQ